MKKQIIIGLCLMVTGIGLLAFAIKNANNLALLQIGIAPANRNNIFYGLGLIVSIGFIVLFDGLRKK